MTDKEEKEFISNPVEAYENVVKQLARKTQECERSRKRISDLEERIINHSNEIEEYCSRLADKNKECEKYEQALEEIWELISDDEFIRCPIDDDTNCNYFTRNKILDIINKAKGE